MKQAKLSFASQRTTSANGGAGKPSKSTTHKRPTRASSDPASADPIVLTDSDSDDGRAARAMKRRRLDRFAAKKKAKEQEADRPQAAGTEREKEKESLDPSDRRWLKLYGQARDEMGSIGPVHAKGQSTVHHILRVFDLSYLYGPCVGVSRLERWERAHALGLDPPPEVKDILLTKEGSTDEQFSQCVFHGEI